MLLALVLLAAPLADEVSGAPPPLPRLPAEPRHATLAPGWYLEQDTLRTAPESGALFDASAQGPQGAPAGTACLLTTPEAFPLAHAELRPREVTFHVWGHDVFYVPLRLTKPVRVSVWRNNAAGKDPVGEVLLGVFTLGLSTLRLLPSLVMTVTAPAKGHASAGGFSVECRTIGLDSVRTAAAARRQGAPCPTLACVADDIALRGPADAELQARAQELVDQHLRTFEAWRATATWRLRSFDILSSARCGATCVTLTVRNTSPVRQRFPRFDEALDSEGQQAWVTDEGASELAPGETRAVKLRVTRLEQGTSGALRFPVVMRTSVDTWTHAPGAFTEGRVEYRTGDARCERGKLLLPVTMRCLDARARVADTVWRSSGEAESLHFPSCITPYVEGEAWAFVDASQPCEVSAVGGATELPTAVLLP